MDTHPCRVLLKSEAVEGMLPAAIAERLRAEFAFVEMKPAFDSAKDDELFRKIGEDSRWQAERLQGRLERLRSLRLSAFQVLIGKHEKVAMVLNVLSTEIVAYSFLGQTPEEFAAAIERVCGLLGVTQIEEL